MNTHTGILLCGHGSRDPAAISEFARLAEGVRGRLPDRPVSHAFLEFARPVIAEGLDALRAAGVDRVHAVPGMLFAAGHVKNDIPSVLNTYERRHPGLTIRYGRDLGLDTRLVRAAGSRVTAAMAAADARDGPISRHDTLLVVVGRGASDPDANANVAKVARLLWEGLGLGWAEVAYSGVTFPLVAPALEHAARLGYRRIVVFPYFLFTGVLVRRIYAHTDEVADRHRDLAFVKAGYLNDHPLVVDTIVERAREIETGLGVMNCQLCKYREQVLGFETERGLPQESHHHHVEGVGTGSVGTGSVGTGSVGTGSVGTGSAETAGTNGGEHRHHHGSHHHAHPHPAGGHHHPYPHADHPLGPVTLARRAGRGE